MLAFAGTFFCVSCVFLSVSMLIRSIIYDEHAGIALWSFICGLFVTAIFC